MEEVHIQTLLFLVASGFFAAFVDSVVGGGGLISLPALMFVGLPPSMAVGTNKFSSTMGSFTSTLSFLKSGKINVPLIAKLLPLTLVGSVIGAFAVQQVSNEVLHPLMLVLLIVVTIYTLLKKNWGSSSTYRGLTKKKAIWLAVAVASLGFYDGFFGPGTGSFLLFIFLMLGFDFVHSAGNAKALNFGSNIASLIVFLFSGLVNFSYGIPMGIAMIVGAYVGSNFAIKKGASYVKTLFVIVTLLLISKNILEYFKLI